MKKTSLLVALFALLLSQSAVAASPAQGEVLAVLHEWLDALAKNDLPRIERIMADDYRITVSNGRILDKREDLEPLKSGKVKFDTAEVEDVNVRMFGTAAVVTGVAKFTARVDGKPASFKERFTDVYAKRNGRWQPVASHTTPIKPPAPAQSGSGQ